MSCPKGFFGGGRHLVQHGLGGVFQSIMTLVADPVILSIHITEYKI